MGGQKYHYLCFFVYVNVFLSLSYLQYLQVLIQNKALLGRLQAPRALLGVAQSRSRDWLCTGNYAWPKQSQGSCSLCKDQAGLGGQRGSRARGGQCWRASGGSALDWVALKGERTTRAKWSNGGRKGHQAMNAKTSFLPSLLPQTEGTIPHLGYLH